MQRDAYLKQDAMGLSEAFKRGETSALALAETAIALAEALNPQVNAVILKQYEAARRRAEALDAVADKSTLSPLAAAPFLLKDNNIFEAGVPTSFGSNALKAFTPAEDSELTRIWREAGLVWLGRSNAPEFAATVTTEPAAYGPTRNPHAPDRSAGGSSGGAAAAVACGIVPAAHGNDAGGSIRIPASCCGLFGLRPTPGLVTMQPHYAEGWFGLNAEHVLTRSVRDSAAFLDLCAPEGRHLQAVGRAPGNLKIGLARAPMTGGPVDAAVLAALDEAAGTLRGLGHEVVETALPDLNAEAGALVCLVTVAAFSDYRRKRQSMGLEADLEPLEAYSRAAATIAQSLSALDLADAIDAMNRIRMGMAAAMSEFDVLMSPVLAEPPIALGALGANSAEFDLDAYLGRLFAYSPFTAIYNMAGLPAMSVPLGSTSDGLPIGVHFAAAARREPLLFSLAGELERAAPWAQRLPLGQTIA